MRHLVPKSPQFKVKGEHQCCKICIEPEPIPLGKFSTIEVQPKTTRNSPKNIAKIQKPGALNGHFLPKLTDLNLQSESTLPNIQIQRHKRNSKGGSIVPLPKLTINTRPFQFKAGDFDVKTDENTDRDCENVSQALHESQIGLLNKSRDSSPRTVLLKGKAERRSDIHFSSLSPHSMSSP